MNQAKLNVIGSLFMILSAICFTGLDTVMKFLVGSYDFWFLAWARSIAQVVFIVLLIPVLGFDKVLKVKRPGIQLLRGFCLACATLSILLALKSMSLTQTYVALLTTPLVSVALSPLVLGERATLWQWVWIIVGFAGAVIALNPATPKIGLYLLYAVLMALSLGIYHVFTRLGSRTDGPYAQLFYVMLIALLFITPLLLVANGSLPLQAWILIFLAGGFGTAAHFFIILALGYASPAVVAPMWYTQILWAAIAGFIVFGEVPTPELILGAVLVVASGIAVLRSGPVKKL